jgi:hypothetical protein
MMVNPPVHMAIIGMTTRISTHRCASIQVPVKVAPERYMEPRKVAHRVGNPHGMATADRAGTK